MAILQIDPLASFSCVGDRCEDTCCRDWDMEIAAPTLALYAHQNPALLDAVRLAQEGEGIPSCGVMRRDAQTGYCVQCQAGWCSVQRDVGEDFLGDACYFFPRITRALGDHILSSATLSCPEITRLTLFPAHVNPRAYNPAMTQRLPDGLRQYLPDGMDSSRAVAMHLQCLDALADEEIASEIHCLRFVMLAQSLNLLPILEWPDALPFYLRMAQGRIPISESVGTDPFNLLHALHGVLRATHTPLRARGRQTIDRMADQLGVIFDRDGDGISLAVDALEKAHALKLHWRASAVQEALQPVLRRYLRAQLSATLFPFAGLGEDVGVRAQLLGLRFAVIRLGLMAEAKHAGGIPPEADVIRVVQTISRVLDHLASPDLLLAICQETGWNRPARLAGILLG